MHICIERLDRLGGVLHKLGVITKTGKMTRVKRMQIALSWKRKEKQIEFYKKEIDRSIWMLLLDLQLSSMIRERSQHEVVSWPMLAQSCFQPSTCSLPPGLTSSNHWMLLG